MAWQFLISGFLLGLVGSVHCVGMCGPIAFALPVQFLPKHKKVIGIFLYNIGRICTYSFLGFIAGFLGKFLLVGIVQQWFTILFGAAILIILFILFVLKKNVHVKFLNSFYVRIQGFISDKIAKQGLSTLFLLGVANGLLPCGMVFIAITGALATASQAESTLYMFLYGLGTLPAMIALTTFGFVIKISVRNKLKKLAPFFLATLAVLLILRGLNLNISYLSPYFYRNNADAVICH